MSDRSTEELQHPIRKEAVLRCTSDEETIETIVVVNKRYENIDAGEYEYELTCGTNTGYYQYHQEDVDDLFVDTGLDRKETKLVMQEDGRELMQQHCDHNWTETASKDLWCMHCRMSVPYPEDDTCPECGDSERTGLNWPEDETSLLVCMRHGVLDEVDAIAE